MILAIALTHLLIALLTTEVIELAVAIPFRVGERGMRAVALVNVVTNPLFNFTIVAWAWLARATGNSPFLAVSIPTLLLLEIAVVVAEWRLLAWALRGTARSPGTLLGLSIAMNVASAIPGVRTWVS